MVLSQMAVDGSEHQMGYASIKLSSKEELYFTIEKECLTINLGIAAFRVYTLGQPLTGHS